VQTRSRMISLCRSLLRQEGIRVPSGGAPSFAKRVRELELGGELFDAVEPLLKCHEDVCAQIALVDKKVAQAVKDDERVQRLTTVPSVGPVTAATFIAIVDNVGRFESSHKLQSYVGLVPREYSSGEKQQRGHITKAGNSRLRVLLVECAWGILRRSNPQSEPLAQWAQRIAERRGKRIAAVALARKLDGHPVRYDEERALFRTRKTTPRNGGSSRLTPLLQLKPTTHVAESTHLQRYAVEHVRRSSAV
jgi:transposase